MTQAGPDWGIVIGTSLGALSMLGVAVASHKGWKIAFGVGAWLVVIGDAIYATTGTGVGVGLRILIGLLLTALVGAMSGPSLVTFLCDKTKPGDPNTLQRVATLDLARANAKALAHELIIFLSTRELSHPQRGMRERYNNAKNRGDVINAQGIQVSIYMTAAEAHAHDQLTFSEYMATYQSQVEGAVYALSPSDAAATLEALIKGKPRAPGTIRTVVEYLRAISGAD